MITLVTGGSGSGKSEYAEQLILNSPCTRRFYIATMIACGKEGRAKVMRHREMRSTKGFITIERPRDVGEALTEEDGGEPSVAGRLLQRDGAVLLECVSNLAANEMFGGDNSNEHTVAGSDKGDPGQNGAALNPDGCNRCTEGTKAGSTTGLYRAESLAQKIVSDIASLSQWVRDMVIVTNEVDRDGIFYQPETAEYVYLMGLLNQKLAQMADQVVEVVYAIPVMQKPSYAHEVPGGIDLRGRECKE